MNLTLAIILPFFILLAGCGAPSGNGSSTEPLFTDASVEAQSIDQNWDITWAFSIQMAM